MINRRELGASLTAALVADAVASLAATPSVADPGISPAARALYARALIVDANLSPPFEDALPFPQADLDMTRKSGLTAMKTSLAGFDGKFEEGVDEIAYFQRVIEAYPGVYMQIREASDFARAKREGRVGIIFSFEGVEVLDGKVEWIALFRNLGVRVMQLSYNKPSPFGAGVMSDPALGITDLGRKAVASMNTLGVAVDLSHANDRTTADAIEASTKPVLITHAGCAAINPHPRNKTDDQLRAVANTGGVVGIYDLPYLTASPKQPTVDDYIMHVTHALQVCGEDHVGIGSDAGVAPFDTSVAGMAEFNREEDERKKAGVAAPGEDRPTYVIGLNTPRRCEVIADALMKRGVSERVTEKVLGANFVRAFTAIWGDQPKSA